MEVRKYKYSGNWWVIILCMLMFGGGAVALYFEATTNSDTVSILGLIDLNKDQSTMFLWVLMVLFILFTILMVAPIALKLRGDSYLIIEQDKIIIPPPLFKSTATEILYEEIHSFEQTNVSSTSILTIYHEKGKSGISSSLFANKKSFKEVSDLLFEKAQTEQL